MNLEKLRELSSLSAKATHGEWAVFGDGSVRRPGGLFTEDGAPGATVCRPDEWEDAEFIAALVNWFRSSELLEMAKDAERYRYMRNNATFQNRNGPGLYWYLPRFNRDLPEGERLDAAIDAAHQHGKVTDE